MMKTKKTTIRLADIRVSWDSNPELLPEPVWQTLLRRLGYAGESYEEDREVPVDDIAKFAGAEAAYICVIEHLGHDVAATRKLIRVMLPTIKMHAANSQYPQTRSSIRILEDYAFTGKRPTPSTKLSNAWTTAALFWLRGLRSNSEAIIPDFVRVFGEAQ